MKLGKILLNFSSILAIALAHGDHGSGAQIKQKPATLSWQNWHMIEEHGIESYDADLFFRLHDVSNRGFWYEEDILNLYGLLRTNIVGDGSGMGKHQDHDEEIINEDAKTFVITSILNAIDKDHDGKISLAEWKQFTNNGGELPDFGYGQGHHFDFELEYEQHHWQKYHAKDDPDVLIKHKEDIEHELLYHEHEIEESHYSTSEELRKLTSNFLSHVNLINLSDKYKRSK
ncbi:uncharacterized protein RJT21DRAFT_56962 [Scheffersomyces amazonensis]|uniref:uncharacterized protein n=1 Tax=Scheffersomyces amazonensis TaxID=1078765 RepID=UPI00315CDBAF